MKSGSERVTAAPPERRDAARPAAQPAAGIVAAALEPDSPGSYLGVGIIPMANDETEAPVYRVMSTAGLFLRPC